MGAGTEGEAGVQAHDRRIVGIRGIRQVVVPRHDPGALAETHRLELVQPRAFPVLVLDFLETRLGPVQPRIERFQRGQQQQCIGVGSEQRGQRHLVPQRDLADAGFEDRLFVRRVEMRILQGHRQRAHVFQRALDARLLVFGAGQAQLQVGHAGERRGGGRAILAVSPRGWTRRGAAQPPRMPFSRPFIEGFFCCCCWPSSICCMSPKSMPSIAVAVDLARRRTLHSGFHGCLGSAGLGG